MSKRMTNKDCPFSVERIVAAADRFTLEELGGREGALSTCWQCREKSTSLRPDPSSEAPKQADDWRLACYRCRTRIPKDLTPLEMLGLHSPTAGWQPGEEYLLNDEDSRRLIGMAEAGRMLRRSRTRAREILIACGGAQKFGGRWYTTVGAMRSCLPDAYSPGGSLDRGDGSHAPKDVVVGAVISYLTITSIRDERDPKRGRVVDCSCRCGLQCTWYEYDLRHGRATSCGCKRGQWRKDALQEITDTYDTKDDPDT